MILRGDRRAPWYHDITHVRFVSENVNLPTFRAVFSRNDGQVIGEF